MTIRLQWLRLIPVFLYSSIKILEGGLLFKVKKRSIDIVLSLLGFIVFSPLFLIVAALIRLTTRKPIFSITKVHGKSFDLFPLYSFNTMPNLTCQEGDASSAKEGIPLLERQLRRLHLTRLPQLINVLKGDMSLVGPCPETPDFVNLFQKEYEVILQMRPGMVDLSSITLDDQPLSILDSPERVSLNTTPPPRIKLAEEYVLNHSLILDAKILIASMVNLLLSWPFPFHKKRKGRGKSIQEVILKYRARTIFCLHVGAVVASSYLAFLLRFDANIPESAFHIFSTTLPFLIACRLAALHLFGLHITLWRYVGVMDLVGIGIATLVSSGMFWAGLNVVSVAVYPRSILVFDAVLFSVIMATLR